LFYYSCLCLFFDGGGIEGVESKKARFYDEARQKKQGKLIFMH